MAKKSKTGGSRRVNFVWVTLYPAHADKRDQLAKQFSGVDYVISAVADDVDTVQVEVPARKTQKFVNDHLRKLKASTVKKWEILPPRSKGG